MRLVSWARFTWNLDNLPEVLPNSPLTDNYVVRRAVKSQEKSVQKAIQTALTLDSDYLDLPHNLLNSIEARVKEAFTSKEIPCLVFCHGSRVVGTSVLSFDPGAYNHLISGPCIQGEYRNRGFGTALLYESLKILKASGMTTALGITKRNVPSGKFVYPKFDGIGVEIDLEVEVAS